MDAQQTAEKKKLTISNIISLALLAIFLIAIPVVTIILGQRTRSEIKASINCKQPAIPDPSECIGGEWRLRENTDGCIRFYCIPKN